MHVKRGGQKVTKKQNRNDAITLITAVFSDRHCAGSSCTPNSDLRIVFALKQFQFQQNYFWVYTVFILHLSAPAVTASTLKVSFCRCWKVPQMTALQQTKDSEHTNAHTLIHSTHMLTQRKQRHVHRQAQRDISSYRTQRRQGLFWLFHSALDIRYSSVHPASVLSPNLLVHNAQTDLQMKHIFVPLPVTALI